MKRFTWFSVALMVLALGVNGCAEKQGAQGKQGPPGAAATATVQATADETCVTCHGSNGAFDVATQADDATNGVHAKAQVNPPTEFDTKIMDVSVTGSGVVNIAVTVKVTLAGTSTTVTNLLSSEIRFGLAKFVPAASSSSGSGEWVNYYTNSSHLATTQTANSSGGGFVNHADGTYTYTFTTGSGAKKDFTTDATSGTNVLRVATQISTSTSDANYPYGGQTATNGWEDFLLTTTGGTQTVQASGPLSAFGTPTNHVVDMASCNECHDVLAMHGGGRRTVEYCEVCHNGGNGGTAYANTDSNGNSIDFKVMLHKVHNGANLPSVEAGGTYGIVGYGGALVDFSNASFPQTITNCEKCHGDASGLTYTTSAGTSIAGLATQVSPNEQWDTAASVPACTSCHDRTTFSTPVASGYTLHSGGAQSNLTPANCQSCHNDTQTDLRNVTNAHSWAQQTTEAQNWAYNITSASYDMTTGKVTVAFNVTDSATNSDFTSGASGSRPWKAGSASRLYLDIATKAKGGADWTNDNLSNGADPGSPLSYNLLGSFPTSAGATLTNDGSGNFTFVSEDLSSKIGNEGTGMVMMEGHPAMAVGGTNVAIPAISASKLFAIQDNSPAAGISGVPRRAVVNTSLCGQCHGDTSRLGANSVSLSLHGNNRNLSANSGDLVCTGCHNSSNTDISQVPSGGTEESIDFKFLVHSIHAGSTLTSGYFAVYGYGGTEVQFQSDFPPGRQLDYCQNCHYKSGNTIPSYAGGGTFGMDANQLPLASGIHGSTVNSGASRTDHSDDLKISPNAAACSACHDTDADKNHMILMGASFGVLQQNIEFY